MAICTDPSAESGQRQDLTDNGTPEGTVMQVKQTQLSR